LCELVLVVLLNTESDDFSRLLTEVNMFYESGTRLNEQELIQYSGVLQRFFISNHHGNQFEAYGRNARPGVPDGTGLGIHESH